MDSGNATRWTVSPPPDGHLTTREDNGCTPGRCFRDVAPRNEAKRPSEPLARPLPIPVLGWRRMEPARTEDITMPGTRIHLSARWMTVLLAPAAFGVLTACRGGSSVDEQLKADLLAASQAPANRAQFASPAELGYPQGYAPYPGQYAPGYQPAAYGYPAPYPTATAPAPQTRVVYVPQRTTTVRTASTASGSSSGSSRGVVVQEKRNTQKGAIIGAATGAAIGVATSRDRVKGGAIGALGGAVLGGVIGHQIKTPPQ